MVNDAIEAIRRQLVLNVWEIEQQATLGVAHRQKGALSEALDGIGEVELVTQRGPTGGKLKITRNHEDPTPIGEQLAEPAEVGVARDAQKPQSEAMLHRYVVTILLCERADTTSGPVFHLFIHLLE